MQGKGGTKRATVKEIPVKAGEVREEIGQDGIMQRTQERFEGITNSRYTNIRERSRKTKTKNKSTACARIRNFREQNISGIEVELDCRTL